MNITCEEICDFFDDLLYYLQRRIEGVPEDEDKNELRARIYLRENKSDNNIKG